MQRLSRVIAVLTVLASTILAARASDPTGTDFVGRSVAVSVGTPGFVPVPHVRLIDVFEDTLFDVSSVHSLLVPALRGAGSPPDSARVLVGYDLERSDDAEAFRKRRRIQISTEFGPRTVTLLEANRLLVPSGFDDSAFPPAPSEGAGATDHLKCYRVRVKTLGVENPGLVTVQDALSSEGRQVVVRKLRSVCVPAARGGDSVKKPASWLACFAAAPAPDATSTPFTDLHVNNQYGPLMLDTGLERELCVAARPDDAALGLPAPTPVAGGSPGAAPTPDRRGPKVTGAVAASANTVVVYFDEPVASDAAATTNFSIAPTTRVQAAELSPGATQVILTTDPLAPGLTYRVTVGGRVNDVEGNRIDPSARSATFALETSEDLRPRIVGAISGGNTSVVVQFSKPMGESAIDPRNYGIVQPTSDGEAGRLLVVGAWFRDPATVQLVTLSQNEVRYNLSAVGIRDLDGRTFPPKKVFPGGIVQDFSTASFVGTPPCAIGLLDRDGDGLMDNDEQRGWIVSVRLSNGGKAIRQVTSDPYDADTDDDGLDDATEKTLGTDPRLADSDGDRLSDDFEFNEVYSDPLARDTDDDGFDDGLEQAFFKTSPNLADTDGDQIKDGDELLASRNARVADLPVPEVEIGEVQLSLDRRLEYTSSEGQALSQKNSVKAALKESNETRRKTHKETKIKAGLELTFEETLKTSAKGGNPLSSGVETTNTVKFGQKVTVEGEHTWGSERESTQRAEREYEKSFETDQQVDRRREFKQSVEGAAMQALVTVRNGGTTAFTIKNMLLSVLTQDPLDRTSLVPVGTLAPRAADLALNLGPLGGVNSRGPLEFKDSEIFPSTVDDLLRNPRGLLTEWANFDIVDEKGRNYAFSSQEVFDRTAGIEIDFGDGRNERYRAATVSLFDRDTGKPVGVTVRYLLTDVLGLRTGDLVRDGGNGRVDTAAGGDDVQAVPVGRIVERDAAIITAGRNGVIDTTPSGDDRIGGTGYETRIVDRSYCVGGTGGADGSSCSDDDDCAGGACITHPVQILTRVRDLASLFADDPFTPTPGSVTDDVADTVVDETRKFWMAGVTRDVAPDQNFDDIVLGAGDSLLLAYVEDKDKDGVQESEEFLYGASDRNPNTDGCALDGAREDYPATPRSESGCTAGPGIFDTVSDFDEIRRGWILAVEGEDRRRVYSNPLQPDSDNDGLFDDEERDCGTDPRADDSDGDGLLDLEELDGYQVTDRFGVPRFAVPTYAGKAILDGGNGIAESTPPADSDDVAFDTVAAGGVVVLAGLDQRLQTAPAGDDFLAAEHRRRAADEIGGPGSAGCRDGLYASNPLGRDTDGDGLFDGGEVAAGGNPNDGADGRFARDTDQDGVPDSLERAGFQVAVRAANGSISTLTVCSSDRVVDTDGDLLPDLLEWMLGTDPGGRDTDDDGVCDSFGAGTDGDDTDGDTLSDFDEFDGPETCTNSPTEACNPDTGDGTFRRKTACPGWTAPSGGCTWSDFEDVCEASADCRFTLGVLDAFKSRRTGTNPLARDTDGDGVEDPTELDSSYTISVNGATRTVTSSPFRRDTDGDGLDDGDERRRTTDATDRNTDGDDLEDGAEIAACVLQPNNKTRCRDPLQRDKRVSIFFKKLRLDDPGTGCDDCGDGDDLVYYLFVKAPGDTFRQVEGSNLCLGGSVAAASDPKERKCSLSASFGPSVESVPSRDSGNPFGHQNRAGGRYGPFQDFIELNFKQHDRMSTASGFGIGSSVGNPARVIINEGEKVQLYGHVAESNNDNDCGEAPNDAELAFGPDGCSSCLSTLQGLIGSVSPDFSDHFKKFPPNVTMSADNVYSADLSLDDLPNGEVTFQRIHSEADKEICPDDSDDTSVSVTVEITTY